MKPTDYEIKIVNTIRAMRNLNNYSQEYCAEVLHTTQANYSRMESGKYAISIRDLKHLSDAFKIQPSELLQLAETSLKTEEIALFFYSKLVKK